MTLLIFQMLNAKQGSSNYFQYVFETTSIMFDFMPLPMKGAGGIICV